MQGVEEWYSMNRKFENGMSISQIAREENVDRKTVRKNVRSPTPPTRARRQRPRDSKLDPYKEYIKSRLKQYNLSAQKIFEEISDKGYQGSYSLVKIFVRPLKKDRAIPAEYRYETKPGEQAQVDWFKFGAVEIDEKRTELWCFSMILGYSRMRFVVYTTDTKTTTFIRCHLEAFKFFQGYPKTILYDNTKNVVLSRALKSSESVWNPLFRDFSTHYGFTVRLCKPGKDGAKTKGKIERTGRYIRENFFNGLELTSLSDLNLKAIGWCNKVNAKPHGTTHEVPVKRLEQEAPVLTAFDSKPPFQLVVTEYRKVSRDCFVSYQGNRYSVPWKYAGRGVKLLIRDDQMEVEVEGEVVCSHQIVAGSNQCIRTKAHFEGLLKAVRDKNQAQHRKRMESRQVGDTSADTPEGQTVPPVCPPSDPNSSSGDISPAPSLPPTSYPSPEVEQRALEVYDRLASPEGCK